MYKQKEFYIHHVESVLRLTEEYVSNIYSAYKNTIGTYSIYYKEEPMLDNITLTNASILIGMHLYITKSF